MIKGVILGLAILAAGFFAWGKITDDSTIDSGAIVAYSAGFFFAVADIALIAAYALWRLFT